MRQGEFKIDGPRDGRVAIVLTGAFQAPEAERLEAAVVSALSPIPASSLLVTWDLRGLDDFHVFARTVLVRIQREVARHAKRTAFFADTPRFRGLGLWVIHLAEDGNARAVTSEQALSEWLDGDKERIDDAEARFNAALALVKGGA